jgi:hypothetical protein
MEEELPLLTDTELEVYRLKRLEDVEDAEISERIGLPIKKVQQIVKSIERKRKILWRGHRLRLLTTNFLRALRCNLVYSLEEKDSVKHIFNIDYSDLYVYLDPEQASPRDLENLGYINYMLKAKLPEDKYCLLPPSAWELLTHLEKVAHQTRQLASFRDLMKNRHIERFYKFLQLPPSNLAVYEEKLKDYYDNMGGLLNILALGDRMKRSSHLKTSLENLKQLTDERKLLPIEEVVGESGKWKKNDSVYQRTLGFLNGMRLDSEINNRVDALNLAITYDLTDEYYKSDKLFYRLVTHSRLPLKAFRRVHYQNKPISCHPDFMTVLILLKTDLGQRLGTGSIDSRISFLEKSIQTIEYIRVNAYDLQYPLRMASAQLWKDENILKTKVLWPVYNYLSKYVKFNDELYKPLIYEAQRINAGKWRNSRLLERVGILKKLFERAEDYENNMSAASDEIMKNLKETYRTIYRFANQEHKDLLTDDMTELFNRIQ